MLPTAEEDRRRPARPTRRTDQLAVFERSAHTERGTGAAVVQHVDHVGDADRLVDVVPQPVVALADLLLRNRVSTPAHPLEYSLHGELDRNHDHVQVHQVARATASATRSTLPGWENTVSDTNDDPSAIVARRRASAIRAAS